MPFVSAKHQDWGGRKVAPGDHLPDVDAWGKARQERYVRANVIRKVASVRAEPPAQPTPPGPVMAEPRSPAPTPIAAPGAVVSHQHEQAKGKNKKR